MSIRIMSRVWSSAPYDGKELLILLAIADFATDEGTFFASKATLAKKSRCSVEFVRRTLLKFIDDGVIRVTNQGWGRGKATEFTFIKAVDNPQEKPLHSWGFPEQKPPQNPPKTPTGEDKTPTGYGYNSNNNNKYQQRCDYHGNPQPCRACRSEQLAGMSLTCHDCFSAHFVFPMASCNQKYDLPQNRMRVLGSPAWKHSSRTPRFSAQPSSPCS